MEDKNLQLLSNLLESLDNKSSLDEVVKAFEVVIEVSRQTREITEEEVKNLRSMFVEARDELKTSSSERFETLKARLISQITEKFATLDNGRDGKDGKDGKDADEDSIVDKILSEIKNEKPTAIEVRDLLESLQKGQKLSIQAIEDLPEILDELRKKKRGTGVGGGGMNAIPMHFIDDETPSGTINGSNTDFTLNLPPATGSLKVYRNGSRQKIVEDYTLSGQTISFTIAPTSGEILLVDYRT